MSQQQHSKKPDDVDIAPLHRAVHQALVREVQARAPEVPHPDVITAAVCSDPDVQAVSFALWGLDLVTLPEPTPWTGYLDWVDAEVFGKAQPVDARELEQIANGRFGFRLARAVAGDDLSQVKWILNRTLAATCRVPIHSTLTEGRNARAFLLWHLVSAPVDRVDEAVH